MTNCSRKMEDEMLFVFQHEPEEATTAYDVIKEKSFLIAVTVFIVAASGPILRWLRRLGTMNDLLGFLLFLVGYVRSWLANLWESFTTRGGATDFFVAEAVELPELVDQEQTESPLSRRPRKRKLPVPPAFRSEQEYPVNWLVYSKALGVVLKTEADKLLEEIEAGCLNDEEKKVERLDARGFIECTPTLISRASSEPASTTTPVSPKSAIKDRSQPNDKSNGASEARVSNGFSPVLQSVVAT